MLNVIRIKLFNTIYTLAAKNIIYNECREPISGYLARLNWGWEQKLKPKLKELKEDLINHWQWPEEKSVWKATK